MNAEISSMRNDLNLLENLLATRDDIKAKIAEIDKDLNRIISHIDLQVSSPRRSRNTDPMDQRIQAVCDMFPEGATVANFMDFLKVKKSTVVSYLYSYHKDLVTRSRNASGKTVWFFKR